MREGYGGGDAVERDLWRLLCCLKLTSTTMEITLRITVNGAQLKNLPFSDSSTPKSYATEN